MLPVYHALTSLVFFSFFSFINGFTIGKAVTWTTIGILSSIMIDLDHIILAVIFNREKTFETFKHPLEILKHPVKSLRSIFYEDIRYHKIFSHIIIVFIAFLLIDISPVMEVVFLAMIIHLTTALVLDRLTKKL